MRSESIGNGKLLFGVFKLKVSYISVLESLYPSGVVLGHGYVSSFISGVGSRSFTPNSSTRDSAFGLTVLFAFCIVISESWFAHSINQKSSISPVIAVVNNGE
jgi:hypothetical protein